MNQLKNIFDLETEEIKRTGQIEIKSFFKRAETVFAQAGFREELPGVPSVLIIRTDVVGDHIITTGFIREVRRNFPKTNITLVVSPLVGEVAAFCPYVNEVLAYDATYTDIPLVNLLEKTIDFCAEKLWRRHFSVAFCPQWGSDNLSTLFAAYFSGAKERYGFGQFPGEAWKSKPNAPILALDDILLTKKTITPRTVLSEAEKNYFLLTDNGFRVEDKSFELWYGGADAFRAKGFLREGNARGRKIIFGPGAGLANRRYPMEKWLVALRQIANDDVTIIVVGGKQEIADGELIKHELPEGKVINLVQKTTLRETAALVDMADMYIGNVTGVMHMASAAHIPIVAAVHEAKDKSDYLPGLYSAHHRFPAWQTPAVMIRPEKAADECAKNHEFFGGCMRNESHCIAGIPPEEIIEGYKSIVRMLTFNRGK